MPVTIEHLEQVKTELEHELDVAEVKGDAGEVIACLRALSIHSKRL